MCEGSVSRMEGSTDSIYEPAYSQTLKEVLPRYQCSPALLRHKPEWTGSDPSINSVMCARIIFGQSNIREMNHGCLMSSGDKKDSPNQTKVQSREKCQASCQSSKLMRNGSLKELRSDRTQTHPPAQREDCGGNGGRERGDDTWQRAEGGSRTRGRLTEDRASGEAAAETAESIHATGRIKKLQNLVQTKKGHHNAAEKGKSVSDNHDHLADVFSNNNPVLTCIGLGKRTEKKLSKAAPSSQQQQQDKHVQEVPADEGVWWSPFECPQTWSPFYHTCQQPQHELWVCGGTLSLPWATEWDRFESLIQELDSKQPDLSPLPTLPSSTDLQLSQKTLTRFGRFDAFGQPSPLMKPQDNGSCLQQEVQKDDQTKLWVQRKEAETPSNSDRKHVKASPETTLTAINDGNTHKDEAERRKVGGRHFTKPHRRSGGSLESLYSLNSGQSSSSGVTSGSGWSSNRDSLRLDDDLLSPRHFCGRARVHTDFVPSPYDTESLKLKVGDVIDIFAKPPMGIWTGMLNGKLGNFKFIYVDVLTEESPDPREETQPHRMSQKSTVQEVLRRLSLEKYTSSLQLNGYQTVEDLMQLKEHHLTELNVTDSEHRHRLLTAVESLQLLHSDWQSGNVANQEAETPSENMKAQTSNCPRDSGCHMPSDSPDNSTEDADLHFYLEYPPPAETAAS
uniref:SAM domain-containing protein SAMSN-1b n=1 Tax=Semicossyphus pulcher TaxID=241346 RepID=UPI0037E9AC93